MPKRSEKRDTAKAEYVARRAKGEKVNLRELADSLGVKQQTMRNWKRLDKWDEAVPPKKRGGQPGNKNSKGKKNAAGSHPGAPLRNNNAEKDGAYSTVYFDMLTEDERALVEMTPLAVVPALEHEMKILKFREHKILSKIAEYERAGEWEMYASAKTQIESEKGETVMSFSDSAFKRVQALQEALYKVQGRIAKVTDSIRAVEESDRRMALEREKLEIMRTRATGAVDIEPPPDAEEAAAVDGVELEDVQ